MSIIIGFSSISLEDASGNTASFFKLKTTVIHHDRNEAEVFINAWKDFESYAAGKKPVILDRVFAYAVSLDPTMTEQQLLDGGFIANATMEDLQNIYGPGINKLYEHILAQPEWNGAVTVTL